MVHGINEWREKAADSHETEEYEKHQPDPSQEILLENRPPFLKLGQPMKSFQ
jgi:hypothetical protein